MKDDAIRQLRCRAIGNLENIQEKVRKIREYAGAAYGVQDALKEIAVATGYGDNSVTLTDAELDECLTGKNAADLYSLMPVKVAAVLANLSDIDQQEYEENDLDIKDGRPVELGREIGRWQRKGDIAALIEGIAYEAGTWPVKKALRWAEDGDELVTEDGDELVTEVGDELVTEVGDELVIEKACRIDKAIKAANEFLGAHKNYRERSLAYGRTLVALQEAYPSNTEFSKILDKPRHRGISDETCANVIWIAKLSDDARESVFEIFSDALTPNSLRHRVREVFGKDFGVSDDFFIADVPLREVVAREKELKNSLLSTWMELATKMAEKEKVAGSDLYSHLLDEEEPSGGPADVRALVKMGRMKRNALEDALALYKFLDHFVEEIGEWAKRDSYYSMGDESKPVVD